MKRRVLMVMVAVLAGVSAYFLQHVLGLEIHWPHWVMPLALLLIVFQGMWNARKREHQ